MLLRTVSLNRIVSCVTMAISDRSEVNVKSRTSCPSISSLPCVTSKKRGSRCTSVVLPDPLAEVHVLEANAPVEWWQRNGTRLLHHFVVGIEKVEDRRRCTQRLLKVVVELREFPHRLVEFEDGHDECQKNALGEDSVF